MATEQLNIFAKITNGKLEIPNRHSIDEWVKTLSDGDNIVIKFRNQKDYFSQRQLRLLYHEFREISQKTGYTVEEVKIMMKMKYGICTIHTIEGEDITYCKSVSDLTKSEISEFILFIDRWSSQNLNHPLLKNDDIQFLKN